MQSVHAYETFTIDVQTFVINFHAPMRGWWLLTKTLDRNTETYDEFRPICKPLQTRVDSHHLVQCRLEIGTHLNELWIQSSGGVEIVCLERGCCVSKQCQRPERRWCGVSPRQPCIDEFVCDGKPTVSERVPPPNQCAPPAAAPAP